jgi:hypothetical protein
VKPVRLSTAIHEAAHAIVCERLHWADVHAMKVNDDSTGVCLFGPQETGEAGLFHDMAVSVAGRVAQAMAGGRDWRHLDLIKVLKWEDPARGARCSYADLVWRRAQLTGDPDPAAASRWVDRELPIAAALAAHILESRWDELRDLAATLAVDGVHITASGHAALEAA